LRLSNQHPLYAQPPGKPVDVAAVDVATVLIVEIVTELLG